MPVNDNGILRFTDRQHLWDYVDYLDALLEGEDEPVQEADVLLDNLERSLNFHSYRRNENGILTHGIPNVREYFDNDYIVDIVFKSILNPYSEVYVGDKLNVVISLNQTLEIDQDATDIQATVREMEKGSEEIPLHLLSSQCMLYDQPEVSEQIIGGDTYDMVFIADRDCEGNIEFYFVITKVDEDGNWSTYHGDITWILEPDDPEHPTSNIIFEDENGSVDFTYQYPSTGIVFPQIHASFIIDGQFYFFNATTEVILLPICIQGGSEKRFRWTESPGGIGGPGDGGPAVAMSSWLMLYGTSWGSQSHRLKAGTRVFKSTNGVDWKNASGVLLVNPVFHEVNNTTCLPRTIQGEVDDCNHCHDVEAKIKFSDVAQSYSPSGLESFHEATLFGILLSNHIEMNLCPQ